MLHPTRAVAAALVALVLAGCAGPDRPAPDPGRSTSAPPRSSPVETTALAVLHAWDVRRSAAWVAGDVRALAGLYLPGSVAGSRDVAALEAYRARGLRVVRMAMQVVSARVLRSTADRVVVEVVDRLADVAVDDGRTVRRLPSGQRQRRRLDLRRVGGAWLVAEVRQSPSAARR